MKPWKTYSILKLVYLLVREIVYVCLSVSLCLCDCPAMCLCVCVLKVETKLQGENNGNKGGGKGKKKKGSRVTKAKYIVFLYENIVMKLTHYECTLLILLKIKIKESQIK